MKRRRNIGPKKQKNRSSLWRLTLYAAVAAVVGFALAALLSWLIGPAPQEDPSVLQRLPGMIVVLTVLTTLAFIFFAVRAYLTGSKARHSLQSGRMKIKR